MRIANFHFFQVSYRKIIVFLCCCHVFLIFHVFWSVVSLFSYLKQLTTLSLLIGFVEKNLLSALLEVLMLSQSLSIDMPTPHFLFTLQRILIVCPSQSFSGRPGAYSLPFVLIKALPNDQICGLPPNPTLSDQHVLTNHLPSIHLPPLRAHTGNQYLSMGHMECGVLLYQLGNLP